MPHKILILNGNPKAQSFCGALAEAAAEGAGTGEARLVALSAMAFDPDLRAGYDQPQPLEPDLEAFWQDLQWCDHLIVVHPLWWGSAPAKLKGLFDRALLPRQAFRFEPDQTAPKGLLAGRSADLVLTSDTPGWFFRLFYRAAWVSILRRQILGTCGIRLREVHHLSPIRSTDAAARDAMLTRIRALGAKRAG